MRTRAVTGRYIIAVASLGDYRAKVVSELQVRMGDNLTIFAGAPAYDPSIRLIDYEKAGIRPLRNWYFGRSFLLQDIPFRDFLSAQSLILDLNPRVPHVWLFTALRRLLGRKTILWGHAWPHAGRGTRSDVVRGALRRLATGLVAYTDTQAAELRDTLPNRAIESAPNSLYRSGEMRFQDPSDRFRILYVGRLVAEKKPELLLRAFLEVANRMPGVVLTIVGDGPERMRLQALTSRSPMADRVVFPGYISDLEQLRPIYGETFVSVSPGYVGLSVTQSFAFGVPMLISRDENHSPEIEAVREGINAEFFSTDDVLSLSSGLLSFFYSRENWRRRGDEISEDCARRYSVERMAKGLANALIGTAA